MALPTPLTASQVGGSADANEVPVQFNTGPHRGQVLLVSKTDPNLQSAIDDGSVTADASLGSPPASGLTFGAASPLVFVTSPNQVITITGTGFTPDLVVEGSDSTSSGFNATEVITPTSITATFDLTGFATGPGSIVVYDPQDNALHTWDITINEPTV